MVGSMYQAKIPPLNPNTYQEKGKQHILSSSSELKQL